MKILLAIRLFASGLVGVDIINSDPSHMYVMQRSADCIHWSNLQLFPGADFTETYFDLPTSPSAYYRAVDLGPVFPN